MPFLININGTFIEFEFQIFCSEIHDNTATPRRLLSLLQGCQTYSAQAGSSPLQDLIQHAQGDLKKSLHLKFGDDW